MLDVLNLPEVGAPAVEEAAPTPPPATRRPDFSRRWRRFAGGILLVASVATLVWWRQSVVASPGLELQPVGGVFRSAPGDITGITHVDNHLGQEYRIEFQPGGSFMAFFGLYNGGSRSVRIEGMRPLGFYYWGFEGLSLSEDERTAFAGKDYGPFRPFTLHPGQTRYARLDFRLAGCDPAGLQDGGYSVVDSLPVTYKVLGFRRTVDVPFDKAALAVMAMGECNHPFLPRR